MGSIGAKVSRAGFPVETAADNQLLFSSAFPSLMAVYSGSLPDGQNFNHNLGYYPAFAFYQDGFAANNSDSVTISLTTLSNNCGTSIYYHIFGRDLRTNLSGVNINQTPATQIPISQHYGFKASKAGVGVETATIADLICSSGVSSISGQPIRQQIIHQTGYQDNVANGATINISHNLGYVPLFYCYKRSNGNNPYSALYRKWTEPLGVDNTLLFNAKISSSQLTIINTMGGNIDIAYIIFKDPF